MTVVEVGVSDQSASATLLLYRMLIPSAETFKSYHTILLISSPVHRSGARISTCFRSQIEVDPDIAEAEYLRKWVRRDNCPINENFPEDLLDTDVVENSPMRLQFTLASLNEFVVARPREMYAGYLSVLLADVYLMGLYKKKRLFSMECCHMPIYGNNEKGRCGQCGILIHLRINPDLVREMADETGSISSATQTPRNRIGCSQKTLNLGRRNHSKVLWSDEAWTQLLGRSIEAFADLSADVGAQETRQQNVELLRYLEERLQWMRVILLVRWSGEYAGGRLAVVKVVA